MNMQGRVLASLALAVAVGAGACEDVNGPDGEVALLSVHPPGGSVGVVPGASVVITFDGAIMPEMIEYAALHLGGITGPVTAGSWTLSQDSTVLTFAPAEPLLPATLYTIHLGGGIQDCHGQTIDFDMHGTTHMGGQWASGSMMGGGGMGGQTHMGAGWRHANGAYGMIFTFTTAG